MADPVEVLAAQHGGARWKLLTERGVSSSQLAAALRKGRVVRFGYGVYGLPGISKTRVETLRHGGTVACLSAAQERGFWVLIPPDLPHIALDRGEPTPGFIRHRAKLPLSDSDVVIQVLRCADEVQALVVLTSAVRQSRVSLSELLQRLKGKRDAKLRALIRRCDPHAESALEVASRFHLENAGFVVASQVYLPGLGRMDQYIDHALALELMGKQYHLNDRAFAEDLRRFNLYTVAGVPVLRVGFAVVVYRPEEFIALVGRAMETVQARSVH
ncbi:hypothetical protein [Psychromicrobium sp. YIM B11713]|uniref:hypothetical protein n=1 Tax=Psychromicrobium sp. YIM B11713 TaxID=3145233 RepID=UPI00374F560D